jgi:hypothetical protein
MAYCDPACIERIEFIKAIENKYAFLLSKIKMLLSHREQGMDVMPLIQLGIPVFGESDSLPLIEAEFCLATGFKPAMVRERIKYGLLVSFEMWKFNQQDVAICEQYGKFFALGANMDVFVFGADAAEMTVDMEMRTAQGYSASA